MNKIIEKDLLEEISNAVKNTPGYDVFGNPLEDKLIMYFIHNIEESFKEHPDNVDELLMKLDEYLQDEPKASKVVLVGEGRWRDQPEEGLEYLPYFFGSPDFFIGLKADKWQLQDDVRRVFTLYLQLHLLKEIGKLTEGRLSEERLKHYQGKVQIISNELLNKDFKVENHNENIFIEQILDGFERNYRGFMHNFNLRINGKFNIFHKRRSLKNNLLIFVKSSIFNDFSEGLKNEFRRFTDRGVQLLDSLLNVYRGNITTYNKILMTGLELIGAVIIFQLFLISSITINCYQVLSLIPNMFIMSIHDAIKSLEDGIIKRLFLSIISRIHFYIGATIFGIKLFLLPLIRMAIISDFTIVAIYVFSVLVSTILTSLAIITNTALICYEIINHYALFLFNKLNINQLFNKKENVDLFMDINNNVNFEPVVKFRNFQGLQAAFRKFEQKYADRIANINLEDEVNINGDKLDIPQDLINQFKLFKQKADARDVNLFQEENLQDLNKLVLAVI